MISTETRRSQVYEGTGSVKSFTFPFRVFAADQVKVYVRAAAADSGELLDTAQYSVTLAATNQQTVGGTVTLATPLAAGAKLVILSDIPYTQLLALQNQGAFNAEDLNAAWDKNTALSQQLLDRLERAVLTPELGGETAEQFTQSLFAARDEAAAKAGEAANSASASAASAAGATASATEARAAADEAVKAKDEINVTRDDIVGEAARQLTAITDAGTAQVAAVLANAKDSLAAISAAGTTAHTTVVDAGEKALAEIAAEGSKQTQAVETMGTTWKNELGDTGRAQAALVESTATGIIDGIEANAAAAASSAKAAAASQAAAKTSETNAKASQTAAKTSETAAKASQDASAKSQAAAKASETAAKASQDASANSAKAAATSQAAAASSEAKAKEYANQAAQGQLQADWTEADATAKTYVKNLPVIDGVDSRGLATISHFAVCSTAAAVAEKAVSVPGFKLVAGACLRVFFIETNTAPASGFRIKVNTLDAVAVKWRGGSLPNPQSISANSLWEFVYDGANFIAVGDFDRNIVWQEATTAAGEIPVLLKGTTDPRSTTSSAKFAASVTLNPSTGTITATAFKGALSGKATAAASADSATTASKLGTANVGAATTPIYLKAGVATAGTPLARVATTGAYADLSGGPDLSPYAKKNEVTQDLAGKAPMSHTHTIANVTGLQVDLTAIRESITNVSSKVEDKLGVSTVHIIDTWKSTDGNYWYRKWSDGFIEQGGKIPNGNAWTWYTEPLNTPFTTTSYAIVVGVSVTDGSSAAGQEWKGFLLGKKGATSFRYRQLDDVANSSADWYACGY